MIFNVNRFFMLFAMAFGYCVTEAFVMTKHSLWSPDSSLRGSPGFGGRTKSVGTLQGYSVKIMDMDENKKPVNERVVELSGDMTILDALLQAGEDAPHSCKAGLCTDCAVLALSGQESIELEAAVLDPETTEKGFVLACSAKVRGDNISLLLGVGEDMYEDQFGQFRKDHESYQEGGSNSDRKPGQLDGILNLNVEA